MDTIERSVLPASWVRCLRLVQRLNQGMALDIPVTWLSLNPSDDDSRRFFAYLIAAQQNVDPALGREIESVLNAGHLLSRDIISPAFIKAIYEK